MQWDTSKNAGFCNPNVEPWLPCGNNLEETSVEAQKGTTGSMLEYYRELITLRNQHLSLQIGEYEEGCDAEADAAVVAHPHLQQFLRQDADVRRDYADSIESLRQAVRPDT